MDENNNYYVLEILNWNKEFKKDIKSNIGFIIKDSEPLTKDRKRARDGIYSPKFMANDLSDEYSFLERYSCECKHMKGKFNEGMICKKCSTEVKYKGSETCPYPEMEWGTRYLFDAGNCDIALDGCRTCTNKPRLLWT